MKKFTKAPPRHSYTPTPERITYLHLETRWLNAGKNHQDCGTLCHSQLLVFPMECDGIVELSDTGVNGAKTLTKTSHYLHCNDEMFLVECNGFVDVPKTAASTPKTLLCSSPPVSTNRTQHPY